ncbi:hypothetical protein EDD37DRAFT_608208 [Exophiala viscosa]|uniref:uncharacterized protein n=1 Tax=Exophiala viscosa TaxID=2486360 RepID=UPI0021987524|nr:hypothetical protein EDD37DRAFT_608208 [Exophiala viscosa]
MYSGQSPNSSVKCNAMQGLYENQNPDDPGVTGHRNGLQLDSRLAIGIIPCDREDKAFAVLAVAVELMLSQGSLMKRSTNFELRPDSNGATRGAAAWPFIALERRLELSSPPRRVMGGLNVAHPLHDSGCWQKTRHGTSYFLRSLARIISGRQIIRTDDRTCAVRGRYAGDLAEITAMPKHHLVSQRQASGRVLVNDQVSSTNAHEEFPRGDRGTSTLACMVPAHQAPPTTKCGGYSSSLSLTSEFA